ncbi:MAG: hypothetical protein ACRD5H_08755 [Nitrososphaerales archaeon]
MSARYSIDEQVCEMKLYPKRTSNNTVYLNNIIPLWEMKKVLEEIVPSSLRGKEYLSGLTWVGGGIATTMYIYENVTIDFRSSVKFEPFKPQDVQSSVQKSTVVPQKDETIDIDLQVAKKEKVNRQKQSDDFSNHFVRSAEVVIISWKNRKCPSSLSEPPPRSDWELRR